MSEKCILGLCTEQLAVKTGLLIICIRFYTAGSTGSEVVLLFYVLHVLQIFIKLKTIFALFSSMFKISLKIM